MSNCSKTNASSVLSVSLSKSSLRVPKRDGRHTGGVWKNVFCRRLTFCVAGVGSRDEERLVRDLFRGYNKLIRPVENMTQKVEVAFGLAFIQLINVVSSSSSSLARSNGHFSLAVGTCRAPGRLNLSLGHKWPRSKIDKNSRTKFCSYKEARH